MDESGMTPDRFGKKRALCPISHIESGESENLLLLPHCSAHFGGGAEPPMWITGVDKPEVASSSLLTNQYATQSLQTWRPRIGWEDCRHIYRLFTRAQWMVSFHGCQYDSMLTTKHCRTSVSITDPVALWGPVEEGEFTGEPKEEGVLTRLKKSWSTVITQETVSSKAKSNWDRGKQRSPGKYRK